MTKRFAYRLLLPVLLVTTPLVATAPADAQWAVFDPGNYAQNLLSAERALTQINNQIKSLQNQTTMLTNMGKNLSSFSFPELTQISTTLQKIQTLMGQAQGIDFKVSDLDAQFTRLFPGVGGTATTGSGQVADAQARLSTAMAAYRQTMVTQSQIAENVGSDASTLATLAARSQSAEGALQVAQATNQLLALVAKQQFQTQQMMATQYRAETVNSAAQAQATIDAQAATKTFLGSGSAYTPR